LRWNRVKEATFRRFFPFVFKKKIENQMSQKEAQKRYIQVFSLVRKNTN
jgi:hypothetical protein